MSTDPARLDRAGSISAIVVICDDAETLPACLLSLRGLVDELVVIDMESTDEGPRIARAAGARVVAHPRLPFVEPARNLAVSLTTHEWVLVLDPDERITPALVALLRRVVAENATDVVLLPFVQEMFGRPLLAPGARDALHPRFHRRDAFRWPERIHEHPNLDNLRVMRIDETRGRRENAVVFHDTWRSTSQVLTKFARYAGPDAERRFARGDRFTTTGALRSVARQSLGRLVVGRSYEDGVAGVLHAGFFGCYEFAVQAELWRRCDRPASADRTARRLGAVIGGPLRWVPAARELARSVRRRVAGVDRLSA